MENTGKRISIFFPYAPDRVRVKPDWIPSKHQKRYWLPMH